MRPTQKEAALNPETSPAQLWELAVSKQDDALVDLLLVSVSTSHKIAVIKALKNISHHSLYTVKKWTDEVPCFINRRGVARDAAARIQQEVNAAGGLLKLQPKVTPTEDAIWVAQNPSAPLDLLWALGSSDDLALRRVVLQHPLLPEPLLYYLGAESPALFLQNPVIQLAILEDPEVFFRWPERVRAALLTLPDVSEELLRRVIIGGSSTLRGIALAHPQISAPFLYHLAIQKNLDQDLCLELAAHPKTPPEALALMSQTNFETILGALAQNPNTPLEVLRVLSQERGTVRNSLAQNPSTPPALLLELALSGGEEITFSFQKNLRLGEPFLEALARHESPHTRRIAAAHPKTPPETLSALSTDPDPEVVCNVAQNPATSSSVLTALVARKDPKLSEGVAQNPSAPGALLQQIIAQTPPSDWYQTIFLLAQNPSLTEETCQRHLPSMDFGTRRILATNTRHATILAALSREEARELRVAVAQNPHTPQEILATLLEDPEDSVKQQALSRYRSVEWM